MARTRDEALANLRHPDVFGDMIVRRLIDLPAHVYVGPDLNPSEQLEAGIVVALVVLRLPPKKSR